ncbi:ATPase BadF/BadG/BcrA/BcrD type [Beutenbergia cavernae DSM 12333]|uniref:ATPase BadF/BadG/BcrA/BcrD type n=1 Tax=Beutenbergia cavernae (strain ATCC BAA-8 / DSM 12333 / CCUG 43141 / JCM 11478 / NBRC 16432 / NCIMB 13614 / HKI 0122) TaxID=471853 RepID=C5C5A0_BEUC1|nr:BadF/BadG/BcrA/BcrD ATPase family protein [Beutenbergia cavernae]ACQ82240.1 ATPase BadF/BadG/BcrA/BcrD type [Beutenbergia cavernae DSM 12333]
MPGPSTHTGVHLAVDAGGTSTRAVVVRDDGTCLGYGRSGSGNPISAGPERAGEAVAAAARDALDAAGLPAEEISSVVAAMAGADTRGPTDWLVQPLAHVGLPTDVAVEADLLAAFLSGGVDDAGYALVAGTGAIAVRVRSGRLDGVADGLGWLLGDDGSGFWIGARVVRAALAAVDGRRPPTALTQLVLDELRLTPPEGTDPSGQSAAAIAITRELYRALPVTLARFAPLAFAVEGDPTADQIVAEAGALLVRTLRAVLTPGVTGPLVLGGSVLAQQERLATTVRAAWPTQDVRAVDDGVIGTAVLALRRAGVPVDAAVHARIAATLAPLRG